MMFKHPRIKDPAHLDFIRSLYCASCADNTSVEAAHLRAGSLKYGKRETGMGEKPSDRWALPLCSLCHREQHSGDESLFWALRGINPWVLALTLYSVSGDAEMASEVLDRCRVKSFA